VDPEDQLAIRLAGALGATYRLGPELGRGGMGVVYRATDTRLQRDVAIKVLPPELSFRDDLRERFIRESRLAGGLSHPNIVPIHDVGEGNGLVWYVMSYVDGESVRTRVDREGPLTSAQTRRVIREVAWALSYAHARGIVHRDIKPDNILIERGTGRALVTDFGIAKIAESDTTSSGTTPGMIMGSLMYMAPEQATGEGDIDQRADIYSLGLCGYFMLGGRPPFERATIVTVAARIATGQMPNWPALEGSVDPILRTLLERCANPSPDDRWETAEQILEALGPQAVAPRPMPAQIRRLVRDFMLVPTFGLIVMVVDVIAENTTGGEFIGWMSVILLINLYVTLRKFTQRGFGWPDLREALEMELARQAEELEETAALRERFSAIVHVGFWAGLASQLIAQAIAAGWEPIIPIALGLIAVAGILQYPFAWLAIKIYSFFGRLALRFLPSVPKPEAKGWFARFADRVLTNLFKPLDKATGHLATKDGWAVPDIGTARRSAMSIDEAFESLPRKMRDDLRPARQLARELTQAVGDLREQRTTVQRQVEREVEEMGMHSRQASAALEQLRGTLEALAEGRGTKAAVEQCLHRAAEVMGGIREPVPAIPKDRGTVRGWFGVRLNASVTGSSPYKEIPANHDEEIDIRVRDLAEDVEARWVSLDLDRRIPDASQQMRSFFERLDRLDDTMTRYPRRTGTASSESITECERFLVDLRDALARLEGEPAHTRVVENLLARAVQIDQAIQRVIAAEAEAVERPER
jgi:hypothetical protein